LRYAYTDGDRNIYTYTHSYSDSDIYADSNGHRNGDVNA
jgi:hypothetical protein